MTNFPPVIAAALAACEDEARVKLANAVQDPQIPAERVSWAFESLGHDVSATTIRTFRRWLRLAFSK